MKKHALKIIGIIFLVFLSWRIVMLVKTGSRGRSQQFGRPPVAVEVDSVRYAPIQEIRQFTGTVYPLYHYIIAPKVSGRIIELRKRIGDCTTNVLIYLEKSISKCPLSINNLTSKCHSPEGHRDGVRKQSDRRVSTF